MQFCMWPKNSKYHDWAPDPLNVPVKKKFKPGGDWGIESKEACPLTQGNDPGLALNSDCWTQLVYKQHLCVDVIYQTRKTVFDHISKHREGSWKYNAQLSIFDKLQGVWKIIWSNTVFSVWYIFSIETKT